jgi:crotonobetainyl-CoA:carnitine CoA-transferase CaiB-like acyl-CoA transferase
MSETQLPLAGLRVLDCSRVYAGPIGGMLLADLGADVVRLEPPNGDETRGWGPPYWGDPAERRSAYFASVNRNKRSMLLDLRGEAGQAVLDRLAEQANLLLHNYQPSVARKLGLDPDRLRVRHPDLVVASVGGFPSTGPDVERPAYDLVAQAITGHMSVTGEPDGEPMKIGVALLDMTAGLLTAIAALAGLLGRERLRIRPAPHLSVSLIEAGVAALTNVLGNYLASGDEPQRWGTAHPDIVPYQVFHARDGHLVVGVGNDGQFARFLGVLGVEPQERWTTNPQRLATRDELVPILARVIATRDRDELVAALTAADVPSGPVNQVSEALAFMEQSDPAWITDLDGIRNPPSPILVDATRAPVYRAPPRPGQHTDEILAEAGYIPAEIAALRAAGVVR